MLHLPFTRKIPCALGALIRHRHLLGNEIFYRPYG